MDEFEDKIDAGELLLGADDLDEEEEDDLEGDEDDFKEEDETEETDEL
jgi:hypothetical protein